VTTGEAGESLPHAPRTPNTVLRNIREKERRESRREFAEAMGRAARETGAEVCPDEKYVQRLESGDISWPHPAYRGILERLCGRPARELGFTPPVLSGRDSRAGSSCVNVHLREAVWASGMELAQFARKIGVDPKTAERWITRGVTPQPARRWKASQILGVDESQLWPGIAASQKMSENVPAVPEIDAGTAIIENSVLEDSRLAEQLRRTFLAGGLAALTLPALGLDELKHITAAVVNAHRYAGDEIVDYFRRQLDSCAVNDGRLGPRQSLPIVLGLIAAIEKMATEAKPATRRDLLRVGAYASEFAGWLYRDVCIPGLANYWRDRAIEWAQVTGDATMQGYVLLKKSQAVWDERDALRMFTLAEASQEGPWRLPARVRAEAAQQQARGHAMLDGNLALMESKLSEARSLLAQDRASSDKQTTDVAAHYDEALFGIQVAICYCEARQPERSLELYARWLSIDTFSRRDYAYFLALKGEAHAVAEEPENAAMAGLEALSIARTTESVRTVQEVTRLAVHLGKWRGAESVHALRDSVLVS
jgi:transcriptional regulator with XRE-family HTH domain